jgi:precorrin-6A/cobalt-precorrin-6A reductase
MRRILILGGTFEARRLAAALAGRPDLSVMLSLAGRTADPAPQPVPVRIGGFGGAEGLARHLKTANVDVLVDATHPYAAVISANAARAAGIARTPLLALRRPPWDAVAGDRWTEVADAAEAVRALGDTPRRVFLGLGGKATAPFAAAPQHHYVIRSVDPVRPQAAIAGAFYITGRGPFDEADELALLKRHRIEMLVARNSGGGATYGKIAAARALSLPVTMLRRPSLPQVPGVGIVSVETVEEAVAWLDHAPMPAASRGV